uniref:Uncharacterized protein n=1 Tax=Aegilops tauschii subsp. strangulata TaxID=200361 RepID=A0A453D8T2_AEGTS
VQANDSLLKIAFCCWCFRFLLRSIRLILPSMSWRGIWKISHGPAAGAWKRMLMLHSREFRFTASSDYQIFHVGYKRRLSWRWLPSVPFCCTSQACHFRLIYVFNIFTSTISRMCDVSLAYSILAL